MAEKSINRKIKKKKRMEKKKKAASPTLDIPSLVVKWLAEEFVVDVGALIPKQPFYVAYKDFCKNHGVTARDFNIFSKIIYQMFPGIYSRRLGPPGHQIPHFSGLRPRSESILEGVLEDYPSVPEIEKYRNSYKKRKNLSPKVAAKSSVKLEREAKQEIAGIAGRVEIEEIEEEEEEEMEENKEASFLELLRDDKRLTKEEKNRNEKERGSGRRKERGRAKRMRECEREKEEKSGTTTTRNRKRKRVKEREQEEREEEEATAAGYQYQYLPSLRDIDDDDDDDDGNDDAVEEIEPQQRMQGMRKRKIVESLEDEGEGPNWGTVPLQAMGTFQGSGAEEDLLRYIGMAQGVPGSVAHTLRTYSAAVDAGRSCWLQPRKRRKEILGENQRKEKEEAEELSARVANVMSNRLMAVYTTLAHEDSLANSSELRRYAFAFAYVYWPFLPFHWSVVDSQAIDDFLARGEMEKSVLTLNFLVALYSGATNLGNFTLGKELYDVCRGLVEELHDEMDLNLVIPLIFLSANAFGFVGGLAASRLATSYMCVAQTICEMNNATDTEIYCHVVNFVGYLRGGVTPPLPHRRYPLQAVAGFHDDKMIMTRTTVRDAISLGLYMQHAIYLMKTSTADAVRLPAFQEQKILKYVGGDILSDEEQNELLSQYQEKQKEQGLIATVDKRFDYDLVVTSPASTPIGAGGGLVDQGDSTECLNRMITQEEHYRQRCMARYRPQVRLLKRNLKEAHKRMRNNISDTTMRVLECLHYPILSEMHFLMGDMKKALKFAVRHLDLLGHYVSSSVAKCKQLAEIFAASGQKQYLEMLLGFLHKYIFMKDIERIYEQCHEVWTNADQIREAARAL